MSESFLAAIEQGVVVADGAMGTMLQRYGLVPGECPELLNTAKPDVVAKVHSEYVAAGARLLETNTFGANAIRLARYGLGHQVTGLNTAAVAIARQAAGGKAFIAGSVGPLGELLEPYGSIAPEAAKAAYAEQVGALAAAGVDVCIVETMTDLAEAVIAVQCAVATGLPVVAQMSYEASGYTFMGVDPQAAAQALAQAGATIVGANCSVGPEQMLGVLQVLHRVSPLPISALPNAGMPEMVGGQPHWPLDPETFASWGLRLVAAGAVVVGGCCGTTPEHIATLVTALRRQGVRLA